MSDMPHQRRCYDWNEKRMVAEEDCNLQCCVTLNETSSHLVRSQRTREEDRKPECGISEKECQERRMPTETHDFYGIWPIDSLGSMILLGVCGFVMLVEGIYAWYVKLHPVYGPPPRPVSVAPKWQQALEKACPPIWYEASPTESAEPSNCDQEAGEKVPVDCGEMCCICLTEFDGTFVRKLWCGHTMHQDCFDCWCEAQPENNPRCPLCRLPALQENGRHVTEATPSVVGRQNYEYGWMFPMGVVRGM